MIAGLRTLVAGLVFSQILCCKCLSVRYIKLLEYASFIRL